MEAKEELNLSQQQLKQRKRVNLENPEVPLMETEETLPSLNKIPAVPQR